MPNFYYPLSALINGITSTILGLFVLSNNFKSPQNRTYFLFTISVSIWSYAYFLWQISTDAATALFYCRLLMAGAVFIPIFYFHHIAILLNKEKTYKRLTVFLYLFGGMSLLATPSPFFVVSVTPKLGFQYWPDAGPLFTPFLFVWIILTLYSEWIIYTEFKQSHGLTRKQLSFILPATIIGYVGGITNYFLWYNINILPIGNITASIYVALTTYAILRHRFMNIEVVIRKTLVFAGLFGVVMLVVTLVTTLMQDVLGHWLRTPEILTRTLCIIIAIGIYDPVRKVLVNLTDKYLFQKKENIQVILNRLAQEVVMILDFKRVVQSVLETLQTSMRVETGAIIVRNADGGRYERVSQFGLESGPMTLEKEAPLIQYFSEYHDVLSFEDPSSVENMPPLVKQSLQALKAMVVIPLVSQHDLLGLLILGKKKSDQDYGPEELGYFPIMASQISIAISNARLTDEIIRERVERVEVEKKAEMVSYSRTIAHEIKNALARLYHPANELKKVLPAAVQAVNEKFVKPTGDRIWPVKLSDLEKKLVHLGEVVEAGAIKIEVVARTASWALKGDAQEKTQIFFRIPWDTAKEEADKNRDIQFTSHYPDPFVVWGVMVLIQQVFVNLISNAREAMEGQAEKKIHLEAGIREQDGRQVAWFEFSDNGPGILPEIADKIFAQGFSTKPKPEKGDITSSGFGFGLYVCQKIVEDIHGGKIWVESTGKPGAGAVFKFWLPMNPDETGAMEQVKTPA